MSDTAEHERIRQMADKLDFLTEEDFTLLANATPGTVEAWRKRGTGPAYVRLGRRFLYPRKAVAKYLDSLTRERAALPAKGML
ncbi:helix-turn-helix transcriptional regulator [Hydrogenophaga sp. BPS33]|uniref:helix-turn-helix transcriptional regulator n=1 Tax=Hydrogenophaga sp. BPS33 TaxID=2651974 RepID=UPI00131FFF40|nr:helix-turn-helix domain-containing protein [Hydrogenophaga sp. BPS33]QHE85892.1 helix-turn-helix domain-containing protein [Hydrogenophaga sp. BPS33]